MDDVASRIRRRIAEDGPMPFDVFMREALYGAGGFYEDPPVGADGDFVTSPHVHPLFSRLVGAAIESLWQGLGRPTPLRLVEVGAGVGTLLAQLRDGFDRGGIALDAAAVEVSPGAREALGEIVPTVVAKIDELPPIDPGVVVANELLDNLPFRRVRRRGAATVEVLVTTDRDGFAETERPVDDTTAPFVPPLRDGEETTIPVDALGFVDALAARMRRGYALLLDYAGGGPPRAYRAHRVTTAVLADPGRADITADVDLRPIVERARSRGLARLADVPQWAALLALGFERWMHDELEHQAQLLGASRGAEAMRTYAGRQAARVLLDPAGLGRIRWLLLSTPGLPAPPWVTEADDAARRR